MKILISVTPRKFKRDFNGVMKMCTDMCLTTKTDIIITVPTSKESNVHAEIVKLICIEDGKCVMYEYNKKLIDKYGLTLLILSFQELKLSYLTLLKKKKFTVL